MSSTSTTTTTTTTAAAAAATAQLTDQDYLVLHHQYWSPRATYTRATTKALWDAHVEHGGFDFSTPGRAWDASPTHPQECADHLLSNALVRLLEAAIAILAFNPAQEEVRPVPAALQRIRAARGSVQQTDVELLQTIWALKFTDDDAYGWASTFWPRDVLPALRHPEIGRRCQEVGWLLKQLEPYEAQFAFRFAGIGLLLSRISGVPVQILPAMYVQAAEREGKVQPTQGPAGGYKRVLTLDLRPHISGDEAANRSDTTSGRTPPNLLASLIFPEDFPELVDEETHLHQPTSPTNRDVAVSGRSSSPLSSLSFSSSLSPDDTPDLTDSRDTTAAASSPTTPTTASTHKTNARRTGKGVCVTKSSVKKRAQKKRTLSATKAVERFFIQ